MAEALGTCAPEFAQLRDTFERSLANGDDLGASLAVTIDSELVVDLWGGATTDAAVAWQSDTIANVWSISKPMTSLAILLLTEGELDLHDPVAKFWPGFAGAGKREVTVAQVMSHSSGVAGWDAPLVLADLYDPEKLTGLLEDQQPWWLPGRSAGYHAFTHGVVLGEVVRRVTGKTLGEFFRDEVAGPLGADFHIGLPEGEDHRVTGLQTPGPLSDDSWQPPFAVATRANPSLTGAEPAAAAWRRAEIPSANGHGNARSVAVIQSLVACGGTREGRRYFSPENAFEVLNPQASGADLVLGAPLSWGMGWALPSHDNPVSPSSVAGYWGGMGGSHVLVDLDHRMSMSYVMNRMNNVLPGHDPRLRRFTVALYAGIDEMQRSSR